MKKSCHYTAMFALILAADISHAEDEGPQVRAAITQEIARLESALKPVVSAERSRSKSRRRSGLQTATLGGASLQPSGGLTSAARGHTPKDEWRRIFPLKEQP